MECEWCHREIDVGKYIKYDDIPFCDRDCLGEYLVEQAEDEIEDLWHETRENLEMLVAEEKAEIYKDLMEQSNG